MICIAKIELVYCLEIYCAEGEHEFRKQVIVDIYNHEHFKIEYEGIIYFKI